MFLKKEKNNMKRMYIGFDVNFLVIERGSEAFMDKNWELKRGC